MSKKLFAVFVFLFLFSPQPAFAQTSPQQPIQEFAKARVIEIADSGQRTIDKKTYYFQTLRVRIEEGKEKGKFTIIENGKDFQITKDQLVSKDQEIIINKITLPDGKISYILYDIYRLPNIAWILIVFFILVLAVAGKKGFGSILGMVLSLLVITFFIVPNILKGANPLGVTLIGSIFILLTSGYLAHGISKKTSIALASTLISLLITIVLAQLTINFAFLTGLGSEDAAVLQFGPTSIINLKGLLLSGIIIGTLGALNDITITQTVAIFEIKKANPKLKTLELIEKGISIGKEHAASLVNTLVLAYAGSALIVFIFLVLNPANVPYWVILNNETISGEIINAVAGSSGLLLSVPIVTLLSAYIFARLKVN